MLERLRVDDQKALVTLLGRWVRLQFREGDAQPFARIDPVTEEVRAEPLDHAGYLDRLSVDVHADGLLGRIGIAQFGQVPQDERCDQQRQEDRRDVTPDPMQEIFHTFRKANFTAKIKIKWIAPNTQSILL